jgi:hypothetical protein
MGEKVPFWEFFRNWLIGWIGHALLVQPSKKVFSFIFFFFSFFDMKPLSEVVPRLIVIQIQIQIQIQVVCMIAA